MRRSIMASLQIVLLSILAAVLYGIIHDQFTARLAIEYFTVGHVRLFDHDDPTVHALAWGVIATWWVGVGLGLLLAFAARLGKQNKLTPRQVLPYIFGVMGVSGAIALLVGIVVYFRAEAGAVTLSPRWQQLVSPDQQRGFLIASYVHLTSYLMGAVGALVAAVAIIWRRVRSTSNAPLPGEAPPV